MKKKYCYGGYMRLGVLWLLMASGSTGLLFFCCLFPSVLYAQNEASTPGITLDVKNISVPVLLNQIRAQASFRFIYDQDDVKKLPPVTMSVKNAPLEEVLQKIFAHTTLTWTLDKGVLIIKSKLANARTVDVYKPPMEKISVHGVVTDENGQPLEKVTVMDIQYRTGAITDANGAFDISVYPDASLKFTYIGMEPQMFFVKGRTQIKIGMVAKNNAKEVVVTGMFTRKKESFTGASATYTGSELKTVGNQNVLQSLRTLDPSFVIVENNTMGSNPNALPSIEVRGKSSLISVQTQTGTDANQPLFIVDGFESTLQAVNDLDMNRVAAITVLKDAASTALYGARAANGVIVIETLKPKAGTMRISYTYDFRVEGPDLSSYNMMNAAEKLQYEKLAGMYTAATSSGFYYQDELDKLYNQRLADVQRGVNTYWLSEPLRTSFTHNNAVYAEGGDKQMRYGIGINYKTLDGVMKGSDRNTWGANVDLNYHKGKINISNKLYLSGYRADQSPYGVFSDWVKVIPYYRKRNADGTINKYLDVLTLNGGDTIPNPLYNATLNSFDNSKNQGIVNNLQMVVDLNNEMRITGGLSINSGNTTDNKFVSPSNTTFIGVTSAYRGTYDFGNDRMFGYNGNLMFSYGKLINKVHQLNFNARGEIKNSSDASTSYEAMGFPVGTAGNPAFAYGYEQNGIPGYTKTVTRSVAALATMSYMYDTRFLFDASYRVDGSTSFGSNNKYSPFWSVGVGYNLHNEAFIRAIHWINLMKVRANIGVTGNQNFQHLSSETVYAIQSTNSPFGQGFKLSSLGNPDLKWQNSTQVDIGADLAFLNNRIALTADVYRKNTDPLIALITTPASNGVTNYPFNIGYQHTKGIDWSLKMTPVYNTQKNIFLTIGVTGRYQTSVYGGFGATLDKQNDQAIKNSSLQRYRDGASPDALWAVRSAGIDPATGAEVFIKKDGTYTFAYNTDDEVVVGNAQPKLEGIISANLRIKAFSVGFNMRYTYGGDMFNSALYSRVENLSVEQVADENIDRRALYQRWKQPGDIAQFKAINNFTTAKMSSRYVQRNNYLSAESANIGYDLLNRPWMRSAGMSALRFSAYSNDLFRLASIKSERGTDYPFSHSYSFSVRATF